MLAALHEDLAMTPGIEGKVGIITGGSSGLGEATASLPLGMGVEIEVILEIEP